MPSYTWTDASRRSLEASIVGHLIQRPESLAMVRASLDVSAFRDPLLLKAFDALTTGTRGLLAVARACTTSERPYEEALSALAQLDYVSTPSMFAREVDELLTIVARERLVAASTRIKQGVASGASPEQLGSVVRDAAGALAQSTDQGDSILDAPALVDRALSYVRERVTHPIGILELDNLVDYSRPGTTLVIGAETSMGKSALMIQMAVAYLQAGLRVLYYSLEDPPEMLAWRMACFESGVSLYDYEQGRVSAQSRAVVAESFAAMRLCGDRLRVASGYAASPDDIAAELDGQPEGLVVFVDHLGLVTHRDGANLYEKVSDSSRKLRKAALAANCSIIEAVQLSRGPTQREDGEPYVSDLRDSGMIAADATGVILLWAPERRLEAPTRYVKVSKNRNGPVLGRFELDFLRERGGQFHSRRGPAGAQPDRDYTEGS